MGITLVLKGVQKLKKKKTNLKSEVSTSWIFKPIFFKVLKIQGYVAQQPKHDYTCTPCTQATHVRHAPHARRTQQKQKKRRG